MYPYLTPFGIIMKINRNPLPELTDEIVQKDHEFWSKYSERLIGNWITYDTPVSNVCAFVERTFLRRDFNGFKGERSFVRDDNAQKAFSKLRSAIGGLYFWRISNSKNTVENQRMIKECDFALKQSFAFCPYSPEAVYKYVTLLANIGRVSDAEQVVSTCLKFDPENPAIQALALNIRDLTRAQPAGSNPMVNNIEAQVAAIEQSYRANPTNLQVAFQLASAYFQLQRSNQAVQVLDSLLSNTNADAQTILSVANAYSQIGYGVGLEHALSRLTDVMPDNPEAWYDLSRAQAALNKLPATLSTLQKAIELSEARLKTTPGAKDLAADALTNQSFTTFRANPAFLKVVTPARKG
jgi:tetratricopeptide (TPR) repeat protein